MKEFGIISPSEINNKFCNISLCAIIVTKHVHCVASECHLNTVLCNVDQQTVV